MQFIQKRISNAMHSSLFRKILLYGTASAMYFYGISIAQASTGAAAYDPAQIFLWIALLLLVAKSSSIVERIGFPSVLGEIIAGALLGNLGLLGLHYFDQVKSNTIITFLAELGVVVLLFQIGLESNVKGILKVGPRALFIALVGVLATFGLGFFLVPYLLPGLSQTAYLFLAGTFTSTSVGISARVFRDLGKLKSTEAQLVLGAAVLDDVIGLIILAVLTAMVTSGEINLGETAAITAKAIAFLVGSILLGQIIAPHLGRFFSKIHTGVGMKLTLAFSFGLVFAYLAKQIELAPIIGAFAAGLVLDPAHFSGFKDPGIVSELHLLAKNMPKEQKDKITSVIKHHAQHHIEEVIEPIAIVLVPIFFILTGMNVQFSALFNGPVVLTALGLAAIAIVGKLCAGLASGSKSRWIIGWGMVPRGEVQLIFATIGKGLGIITPDIFSMIVIVVIVTTILTPLILSVLVKKSDKEKAQMPGETAALSGAIS